MEKDRELKENIESTTDDKDQKSKLKIEKFQKRKSFDDNVGIGIDIIKNPSSQPAQGADTESDRSPNEVKGTGAKSEVRECSEGTQRQDDDSGWVCKICHNAGNLSSECEMCLQRKKDSYDEGDIKNRKKRKNLNRSRLKAGHSIRMDEERDRQKKIAKRISSNIEEYCKKVIYVFRSCLYICLIPFDQL